MKTRRQKLSTDRQTTVGRSSADENSSSPIPADLLFEIFLRLSTKYIARCRCVSKLWSYVLDRQDFADQFLKQSSLRPQILFSCVEDGQVSFFSSPQPRNPDENTPLTTTASYHMSLHLNHVYQMYKPISGLVCIGYFRVLRRRPAMISVICNPSTGQYFTLPRIKTRKKHEMMIFFGHDPVEKGFKVLSMILPRDKDDAISKKHQVLTLETGKLSWRMIKCSVPHYPRYSSSVCVDGVIYYRATPSMSCSPTKVMIICFDVRSEKFSFIKAKAKAFTRALCREATLINFNGRLASLRPIGSHSFDRACTGFEMWVLDDPEKKEWSMHSFKMPPQWQTIVPRFIFCVGATGSNEIMFSDGPDSFYVPDPFYVFYYSLEWGTIRRVEIQGMGAFMKGRVFTSLDHVEDVKRMKGVLGL